MTTAHKALVIAKERQLDWLLGEVLGHASVQQRAAPVRLRPWLAAAVLALGLAAAFGTALLRDGPAHAPAPAQDPVQAIEWYECHGPAAIDHVPADVVNLKCFDFDDAALVHLPHFAKLQRLDLSGMDVNDRGYSVSLKITDAGLAHLGGLPGLRWLSLASCHQVKGPGLRVLQNLPMLEHLDLTYTGVDSDGIAQLPALVALRELSLSHCMHFHGRSLADVAKIAGLRRLDLRACTTVAAADARHLARLTQLRHLDLRDCQGRFRGQRASGFGARDEPPVEPPEEDGVGITDATIAALGDLRLETLRLGGSESLTDAIGPTLARMTTLRTLDLSNLPLSTGALLDQVPAGVESLALDTNGHYERRALVGLRRFAHLQELSLVGLAQLDPATLSALLAGMQLTALRIGGTPPSLRDSIQPPLHNSVLEALAQQRSLRTLDLGNSDWVDRTTYAGLQRLPELVELDLSHTHTHTHGYLHADAVRDLAKCRSLRRLSLRGCSWLTRDELRRLAPLRLQTLDLYGAKDLFAGHVREIAAAWPGCLVTLPDGRRYQVPR